MATAYPRGIGTANSKWVQARLLRDVQGLLHGFSTRSAGDFSTPGPARSLVEGCGAAELRLLRQVHGARVVQADRGSGRGRRARADAWAGNPGPGVLLGILTADCVPVLLCHPPSGILGLAHAGWRGALAGVAGAAVRAMGVPARETRAVLGPAVGPCCYQVGEEVAEAVGAGSVHLAPWPGEPGRHRLDLPALVRSDLLAAGLDARAVEILPLCTSCRADLFYSFRRDRATERLCSFLGWAANTPGRERGGGR